MVALKEFSLVTECVLHSKAQVASAHYVSSTCTCKGRVTSWQSLSRTYK